MVSPYTNLRVVLSALKVSSTKYSGQHLVPSLRSRSTSCTASARVQKVLLVGFDAATVWQQLDASG